MLALSRGGCLRLVLVVLLGAHLSSGMAGHGQLVEYATSVTCEKTKTNVKPHSRHTDVGRYVELL